MNKSVFHITFICICLGFILFPVYESCEYLSSPISNLAPCYPKYLGHKFISSIIKETTKANNTTLEIITKPNYLETLSEIFIVVIIWLGIYGIFFMRKNKLNYFLLLAAFIFFGFLSFSLNIFAWMSTGNTG